MQSGSSVESDRPVFYRRIALDSLASFTHRYPSPPPGYDDSEAGGGRTYFYRPLRFRIDENVAQPSPTPAPAPYPGARPTIATRRQGPLAPLFVYTDVNRHFSAALPVASARPPTSPPSPSDSALLHNALLLSDASDSSDSDDDYSPVPLLERDENFNGDPNFSSDDESDADPYEWAGGNWTEHPRIRTRGSTYAVTPAVIRPPLVISDESPYQEYPDAPSPAESAFDNGDNRQDSDLVSRAREIPPPARLFLPGSYTDTPVIDPVAAQAAAEERWQNRTGGTARRSIDVTRLLARLLIACSINAFVGAFLPDLFAVFWLNVLLIALIMS